MRGVRRKQRLQHRVAGVGGALAAAHGQMTPVTGGAASPPAPQVMPLARVLVSPPAQPDYVTLAYQGIAPIWAPDGETIPAAPNGSWGQLIPAGRA